MKKRKIRTSLLAMTMVLVILLSLVLATAGYHIYRQDMIARYQNYAGDSIDCIARCIDGDDLEKCIETGKKSEKYEALQTLANNFKETHDLIYLYIIKSLKPDPPDNMMDVLPEFFIVFTLSGNYPIDRPHHPHPSGAYNRLPAPEISDFSGRFGGVFL